ncbi:MAG: peptidyl-prolyl cis-trans isomerase [Candidatus Omnitrophica bacterium]|nr:peptidyl-prolyl cis-trans isomerase [Candidatus Omnitrophota bacterium]
MFLRRLISCLVLIIGALAVTPAWAVDDAILAIVNDEVITVKDMQDYLRGVASELKIEGKSAEEAQLIMQQYQAKGIKQLIEERLILSAADKSGIQIRPQAIESKLDDIKKKYSSVDDFLNAIKREGLTVSDIKKKIENQIKGQATVDNEVRAKVVVNPKEVTEYYNSHSRDFGGKTRLYLDTVFVGEGKDRDQARKKIAEALKKFKAGVEFKAVMSAYSDLPPVGEVTDDQLRPEFIPVLEKMTVGDVSGIVEVKEGFFIIKLGGRKAGVASSLEDAKEGIYQRLFDEKFRQRFEEWVESLRKKAYVEIKE